MKHYSFESNKSHTIEERDAILEKSKIVIQDENPGVKFEAMEIPKIKTFNSWTGSHQKYLIQSDGLKIGFLEEFVENNLKYINIFTSPL